ncbi:MAG: ABC transporter ATP-binding protein [Acetobacteraceae bacterium]|nr:ABC transporter ATP-binding protein [Acetobacteraceae bacterium]
MLEIKGLSKRFGRLRAVRDVSLTVRAGEGYALIGPNGAGKTTLIKCLLGFYRRYGGGISFDGRPVVRAMAAQQVGYLPERLTFPATTTALDYLQLQALSRGLRYASLAGRVRALTEELALERWLRTPLYRFSKGMSRKLGFIQSVMHQPRLLVLDEPTEGLDPVARRIVLRRVRELAAGGAVVLMTSHLLADLERVSDRVGVILAGSLVAEMPLEQLKASLECTAVLDAEGGGAVEVVLRPGERLNLPPGPCTVLSVTGRGRSLEDWYHEVLRDHGVEGVGP